MVVCADCPLGARSGHSLVGRGGCTLRRRLLIFHLDFATRQLHPRSSAVLRAVGKCGIEHSIEYQLLAFMQLFGPSEVRLTDEGQNPSDTDAASLPYRDHRKPEQMFSGLHSIADIARYGRHVSKRAKLRHDWDMASKRARRTVAGYESAPGLSRTPLVQSPVGGVKIAQAAAVRKASNTASRQQRWRLTYNRMPFSFSLEEAFAGMRITHRQ
jgi:hypothetical protein